MTKFSTNVLKNTSFIILILCLFTVGCSSTRLTSEPSGARVYYYDTYACTTPCEHSAGPFDPTLDKYTAKKEGYKDNTLSREQLVGSKSFHFKLEPIEQKKVSSDFDNVEKNQLNTAPKLIIYEPKIDRGIKIVTQNKVKIVGKAIDSDGIYKVTVNGIDAKLHSGGHFSVHVPLTIGDNIISIKATDNKYKTAFNKFSINRKPVPFSQEENTSPKKRLALLIGNSNYTHGGNLKNPINDVRAMKKTLEDLGFIVIKYENSSQKTMKRAIDEFGRKLKDYSVGLFFYAGHGIQVKGNNYLLPVDAKLENENDAEYDTVRADRVLAKMESARSETNIVILDACRDNPFERSWRRGAKGNGLAFMNAPSGSIIAYATSPGNTASDGTGGNGLYTSAILQHIKTPNITIEQMFKRVRSTIMDWSVNQQVPWESTSLKGDFYFAQE